MTTFALGFLFVSLFTLGIGIAALIFTSFDAESTTPPNNTTQHLFNIVRRINTHTIETVDTHGEALRWHRQEHQPTETII